LITHIVMWNLLESLSDDQKKSAAETMKEKLEGLHGKIDGLESICLHIDAVEPGNRSLTLTAVFKTREDLLFYIDHPEHKKVGAAYVRPFVQDRACMNFED